VAITAVGTVIQANPSVATTSQVISLDTTADTVGDLVFLHTEAQSTTVHVTGVSGGGADSGGWQLCNTLVGTSIANYSTWWWMRLGTVGTANVTLTWSSVPSFPQYAFLRFGAGLGATTSWAVVDSGVLSNAVSGTLTYPTLKADTAGQLYIGAGMTSVSGTNTSAGSTTGGWVWQTDAYADAICYNLSIGSGAVTPPAAVNNPNTTTSDSLGVIFTCSPRAPKRSRSRSPNYRR
jgi:hypothetical protein